MTSSRSTSSQPTSASLVPSSDPQSKTAPDRELEAGARAHFEDPLYYSATYQDRVDDVAFYAAIAERLGGPVLEYGAGNGRITLPIARKGLAITAVDHVQAMLDDLKEKVRSEGLGGLVRLRQGDMRRIRLRKRFELVICPFNTALHLYDRADLEAFFEGVRRHLAPGGHFVVDLSVPNPRDLARDPARAFHVPRFRHPSTGDLVRNWEHFDYDPVRQILFVSMVFEPVKAPETAWCTPLAHRQYFPQEWEALLHYNGFQVDDVFGDFHGGPLDRESEVMVWQTRRRG